MHTHLFSQVSVVDLYNDESSFANLMTAGQQKTYGLQLWPAFQC